MAAAHGDAREPVFEGRLCPECLERPVGPDEGLMGDLLGTFFRHFFYNNSSHIALVSVHQEFKGVDIPLQDFSDDISIAAFVSRVFHGPRELPSLGSGRKRPGG